jgi:hypothetical protein
MCYDEVRLRLVLRPSELIAAILTTLEVPQARVLLFDVFISAPLGAVDFVAALGGTRPALSGLIVRGGDVVVAVSCCLKKLLTILGAALKGTEFRVFRLKMIIFPTGRAKVFIAVLSRTMIDFMCRET